MLFNFLCGFIVQDTFSTFSINCSIEKLYHVWRICKQYKLVKKHFDVFMWNLFKTDEHFIMIRLQLFSNKSLLHLFSLQIYSYNWRDFYTHLIYTQIEMFFSCANPKLQAFIHFSPLMVLTAKFKFANKKKTLSIWSKIYKVPVSFFYLWQWTANLLPIREPPARGNVVLFGTEWLFCALIGLGESRAAVRKMKESARRGRKSNCLGRTERDGNKGR